MSARSRQIVLAIGLTGLLIDAVASHPSFAVNRVTLFRVVTPQNEIVIGITKAELAAMQGKTAEAVTKVLNDVGELQVWQYETRAGTSGALEEAPIRKVAVAAGPATRIEPYTTARTILPITDEIMIEAIR
ncbi:MAG: hypothetical protein NVV83_16915 [Afipia sp.]|nr:hypothetical protein [Afipia sp.]